MTTKNFCDLLCTKLGSLLIELLTLTREIGLVLCGQLYETLELEHAWVYGLVHPQNSVVSTLDVTHR